MIPTEARTLRTDHARAQRGVRWRAILLVAPLTLFLTFTFFLPIGRMLYLSIDSPELAATLPDTARALNRWDGNGPLPDPVAQGLITELPRALHERTLASVAQRMNHDIAGVRSMIMRTARRLATRGDAPLAEPPLEQLRALDDRWGDPAIWAALKRAATPITDFYLLTALDLDRNADGRIVPVPASEAIFLVVIERTFSMAATITVLCLVLGFPATYLLAALPHRVAASLMVLVLLPFWTSLLVRTSAWVVILQNEGMVNSTLQALGVIDQPLQLIFNRVGVLVTMTHVLLPFMILPLYSVMRGIDPAYVRAAVSLGARPFTAFRRVYLPQAAPGIGAGMLLVFILAIGFYVTPALVGGADDQMVSYFIAFYTNRTINWGLAAALASLLLLATVLLLFAFGRLARRTGLGLGGGQP